MTLIQFIAAFIAGGLLEAAVPKNGAGWTDGRIFAVFIGVTSLALVAANVAGIVTLPAVLIAAR